MPTPRAHLSPPHSSHISIMEAHTVSHLGIWYITGQKSIVDKKFYTTAEHGSILWHVQRMVWSADGEFMSRTTIHFVVLDTMARSNACIQNTPTAKAEGVGSEITWAASRRSPSAKSNLANAPTKRKHQAKKKTQNGEETNQSKGDAYWVNS